MRYYIIKNDWDDRTLSRALTWVNDTRDVFETESGAALHIDNYLARYPIDMGRLSAEAVEDLE